MANQLRLSLLEEDGTGAARANVFALERLGTTRPAGLLADARRLVGDEHEAALENLIAAARDGSEGTLEPRPGVQVLAVPTGSDGVALLITSQEAPLPEKLQEKAAAADLAAGVSHEVANALSAIVGWAQVARERPDKAPPEEALTLIEKSAQVARDATQDLLRMVRHTNHERSRADLTVVVRDAVRLLRPEAQKKRVHLHAEADEACWVDAKRSQLFSIVWNLAHNAVQMVPSGGEVAIQVRPHGALIDLEVRDNGPGMSDVQRKRAFEPYYTTRSEGTGLGLAIVRGTVVSLDGKIRLDTSPGQGARFRIQLPQSNVKRESELVPRQPRLSRVMKPEAAQQTHVLVVEDDQGVRSLIATTLALGGVTSTCVSSGAKALARTERFSAALVDLTLPDARGDILLGQLREKGLVSRAAIISGAPPPDDIDPNGQPDRWLRKPFDPSDLIVCVRELVDLDDAKSAAGS